MKRRNFIKTASLGATAIAVGCNRQLTSQNILFIFSDQQHWQALQHVDSFFRTPNLTELAQHSVRFSQAICTK